jgi:hypothetical protein
MCVVAAAPTAGGWTQLEVKEKRYRAGKVGTPVVARRVTRRRASYDRKSTAELARRMLTTLLSRNNV